MTIIIKWFLSTIAVLIAAYLLPGVVVSGFWVAFVVALVLAILNLIIRPILLILTLPINILTLGLFTFVVDAIIVILAASVVPGFSSGGFINALLFSLILTIIQAFFEIIKEKND